IRVMAKPHHAISAGVVEVHAERSAGLSDGAVAVFRLIEEQGEPVMSLGKIRVRFFGGAVLVEGAVPVTLALADVAHQEMQGIVAGVIVGEASTILAASTRFLER